ncbi:MAG: hypothetical protein ABT15_15120 [Pseudonocardia sp. SCN 73-27]|uniref:sensor histidine kinase n=1 Tax=unclassified Pseudonocardia TaxID=2619320 RepID=UPI0008699BA4|nr:MULTISPECIES: hypothetical protein [unclassified Pseudonocardia]ODU25505.1 MAG: hypothetical protein ABS80_09975 [Pseudonocardia sp. SCN 72-51]ODV05785.1 MAG: hypothetical protein ABT15_15120 [Pseudonocardia sp. SCN 73-27]
MEHAAEAVGLPAPQGVEDVGDQDQRGRDDQRGRFVVSEGLTNVAKHSGARAATVTAELTPGGLALEVADDGTGGAQAHPGSGLEGLTDRLAALDARLVVDSGPAGTRPRTMIPCA